MTPGGECVRRFRQLSRLKTDEVTLQRANRESHRTTCSLTFSALHLQEGFHTTVSQHRNIVLYAGRLLELIAFNALIRGRGLTLDAVALPLVQRARVRARMRWRFPRAISPCAEPG